MSPRYGRIAMRLIAVAVAVLSGSCQHSGTPAPSRPFEVFITRPENAALYREFVRFLARHNLADVVPPEQLLRQGTDWQKLNEPAFAFPPRRQWKNVVPVLRLIREEIVPMLGPVDVVSGYRTAVYNRRANGARRSQHLAFGAVDVIPRNHIIKPQLHRRLLQSWRANGRQWGWGLGLYSGRRFHIDTARYRKW